jgi:adenylyltransferase/sulfurtransferase
MHELNPADEIVVYCHHGTRSMAALELLYNAGFRRLKNLQGGIDAWTTQVDPTMPRY